MKSSVCLQGLLLLGGRADLPTLPRSVLFHRPAAFLQTPASSPAPFALPLSAGAACTHHPASSFEQLQTQNFEGKKTGFAQAGHLRDLELV